MARRRRTEEMTPLLTPRGIGNLVRKTADPNSDMIGMLRSVERVRLGAVGPPLQTGVASQERRFEVHFRTFVNSLALLIRFGTERSREVSKA